jgi:hypothetical protein
MPIEIREVIIKAQVRDAQGGNSTLGGTSQANDMENLIQECVNQVLQILEDKKAR